MNKEKALALTNLILGSTTGIRDVCNAYFSHDPDELLKGIAMQVKDPKRMFKVIEQANYETQNKEVLATQSNFGKIQKEIVEQVVTDNNLGFLEANIVNNPMTIGETKDCPEITAASKVVEAMRPDDLGFSKAA